MGKHIEAFKVIIMFLKAKVVYWYAHTRVYSQKGRLIYCILHPLHDMHNIASLKRKIAIFAVLEI